MRTDSQKRAQGPTPLRQVSILAAIVLFATFMVGVASARTEIVVSIPPYEELVQRIAGEDAQVTVLLAPGASPHSFDPTPRDVARLTRADLMVVNGGVDAWALRLLSAAAHDVPVFVAMDAVAAASRIEGGHHDHEHDVEHEHEHGHDDEHDHASDARFDDVNSHVWLDPVLMQDVAIALGERLAELEPAQAEGYRTRAAQLAEDLNLLDAELRETLAPIAGAAFVPFHDAWPYFAQRYDLNLIVEIEPFPGREPSARYLADVLGQIHDAGARAIFSESQLPDRPARIVAQEAGVALGVLDPLGGVEGRRGYFETLRYNADVLRRTLDGHRAH